MQLTPMTSARGMGPLPALVEASEGFPTLQRLFDAVDLPLSVIREPDCRLPLSDLMRLFEIAAQATGDPLFGLRVGEAMADGFGVFGRYARMAPTLRACLLRIARGLRYHQSGTRLVLSVKGELASFTYFVGLRPPSGGRQHWEHTLPALLQTFQLFGGIDWRPLRIEVAYAADRRMAEVERALAIPMHAARERLAIVFPASDLTLRRQQPLPAGPAITWSDLMTLVRRRPPESTVGIVADICRTRLLEGRVDIDGVAQRMGIGVRTLQRRLGEEGHSYRGLVTELRIDRARRLLLESDQPVTAIALDLGYEDPAHFTRAFRQVLSMPPSHFRRRERASHAAFAA